MPQIESNKTSAPRIDTQPTQPNRETGITRFAALRASVENRAREMVAALRLMNPYSPANTQMEELAAKADALGAKAEAEIGPLSSENEIERQRLGIAFVEARSTNGKLLDQLTNIHIGKRNDLARVRMGNIARFDFSQHEDLHKALLEAEQVSKDVLREALREYDVPPTHIDPLIPVYSNSSGNNTSVTTGVIVVNVDPSNPLATAIGAAHELIHATAGTVLTYHYGDITEDFSNKGSWANRFDGLARTDRRSDTSEADMLDNALVIWRQSDIYARLSHLEPFKEEAIAREKLLASVLSGTNTKLSQDLQEKIRTAIGLGIPKNMILSGIDYKPEHLRDHLDQVIIIWRLSRIIGKRRLPKTDTQHTNDSTYLAERGREFLEKSRYSASSEAINYIKRIFGKRQAKDLLIGEEHPMIEYLYIVENPLKTLERMELKLRLPTTSEANPSTA